MSEKTPWADLTSAQRLDVVLLAVDELEREGRDATASQVAMRINRTHQMEMAGWGNNSRRNGLRRMSTATRVTPAITALRNRGLVRMCRRTDGYSGSADMTTPEGDERVRELKE